MNLLISIKLRLSPIRVFRADGRLVNIMRFHSTFTKWQTRTWQNVASTITLVAQEWSTGTGHYTGQARNWFLLCDMQIFSGSVYHFEQPHTQSPFLFSRKRFPATMPFSSRRLCIVCLKKQFYQPPVGPKNPKSTLLLLNNIFLYFFFIIGGLTDQRTLMAGTPSSSTRSVILWDVPSS